MRGDIYKNWDFGINYFRGVSAETQTFFLLNLMMKNLIDKFAKFLAFIQKCMVGPKLDAYRLHCDIRKLAMIIV